MLTAEVYEARKKDFLAYKDTLAKEPTGESQKKEYYVGCYKKEDWEFIHEELKKDGSLEDNIPNRSCDVINDCLFSDTIGVYLLNDAEVASLRNHPKVEYVSINVDAYPGTYLENPDDLIGHNGGKDIKFGDDKRFVSIIPKEEQLLYDFATGEVLVDEFGVPLLAQADAIFVPDATAERSTSVVFGDTNTTYARKNFENVTTTTAIYGDYDVPIGTSIQGLNVDNPTNTGRLAVLQANGIDEVLCGTGGSLKIKKQNNTIITHDQWPYLDVRVVKERGITDNNGNEISPISNKIYVPDDIGITSILGVDVTDSDYLTNKKFLVSGKFLNGNVRVKNVAYNSRLTLENSHTAGDEVIGITPTIPISIGANKVVTVTLNNHGFITGDLVHIKIQAEANPGPGIIILNSNYTKNYEVTRINDSSFSFVHDYSISLQGYLGRVFILQPRDKKKIAESFTLSKTEEGDQATGVPKQFRYPSGVKHQRVVTSELLPTQTNFVSLSPGSTLLNRSGNQLRRHMQKVNPWKGQDPSTVKTNRVKQFGTGKDVDLIVCDTDMWFGHIEFQNPASISGVKAYDNSTDTTTSGPTNYIGGNALKSGFSAAANFATDGSCDLLDLVLDAPYYLDPEFFEANGGPSNLNSRLMTRWDGTVVPKEVNARNWWSTNSTSNRSAKFVSPSNGGTATGNNDFGVLTINPDYTRDRCNGSNTARNTGFDTPFGSFPGTHGTPCASQAYGRQYGWAYNANKWFLNLLGGGNNGFTVGFELQKIFHQIKPTNSQYGNQNPTISSNSWGRRFRASDLGFTNTTGTGYYYYQQDGTGSGGVQFTGWDLNGNTDGATGTAPKFMTNLNVDGANQAVQLEPISGPEITAGNELVASGVIFVNASGNHNRKQVLSNNQDYNNYFSSSNNTALSASTFENGGTIYLKTFNRPGYPGALGKTGSGNSVVYPTIEIGALDDDQQDNNEKERKVYYSNMGNAVSLYAAGDDTLAASAVDYQYRRYDAYYNSSTQSGGVASVVQSLESRDQLFNGTSSACPTAAGLIATKLETNRTWTSDNVKNWLVNDVGQQTENNFHTGSEVQGANNDAWGEDYNSLQGGNPTVIWDAAAGGANFPSFKLNEEFYGTSDASRDDVSNSPSGSFADTINSSRTKKIFVTGGTTAGITSTQLGQTTEFTSGIYKYGKKLGLEISGTVNYNDLVLTTKKGYFYVDDNKVFYSLDNRVNDVKITKSELKKIQSDVVLKVEEQFAESSEVSTTLLGVNRAETQLSLFSNVSSYGLEKKDWEVIEFRGTVSLRDWEERINDIYGGRTRGEYREVTQESAIQLYVFPVPNTFPFGPNFAKNNLYNDDSKQGWFALYLNFIDMGNEMWKYYNGVNYTEFGTEAAKQAWLSKFLNPDIAAVDKTISPQDVIYKLGIKETFAQIDIWTETYRDIIKSQLVDPRTFTNIGFNNVNSIIGKSEGTFASDNTRPGYSDSARRYILLQSRRVFRYQPGRISGFTFGVRAAREFNTGFKLEWGIFNKTDHYVFQLDAGFLKIVRRSKVPLPLELMDKQGSLTTQEQVKSPDPQDSLESEDNPTGEDYMFHELVIPQDNFNGDPLNGRGESGHTVLPQNITMWKIEFGWYGAIGARFYAYIPAGNGEARWVTLHTLIIENQLGQPCLVDPYFRFRYVTNVTKTADLRTPQFVYKYGASYYIDGGDEGTTSQNSIKTKPDLGKAGVLIGSDESAILAIRPKDEIYNSTGVGINNKKIIIPTQLNMTTTALTKVQVGVCTGCPGWAHVHTIGVRRNGTDNSSFLGRSMPIKMLSQGNTIQPFYEDTAPPIYFRKQDIGAKIIAPSIYNCYIADVSDNSVGFNSYTTATIQGFEGHRTFTLGNTRKFYGEITVDRSVSPPERITLPNNDITDVSDSGFGVYQSQASKLLGSDITETAQPVRLSNYDGLAISDYQLSGSEIDIQFTVPRSSREGGLDPTWGYSHWADVLVGVTDVRPYEVNNESAEFAIDWTDVDTDGSVTDIIGGPIPISASSGIRTDVLPNDKILFAEHTHAWASSDVNGADRSEAWSIFQFRSRLGLLHTVPPLVGISSGRCGRVNIRVGDPESLNQITFVTTEPGTNNSGNFLRSAKGVLSTLTPVGGNSYDGGQVAYTVPGSSDPLEIFLDDFSKFKGELKSVTDNSVTPPQEIEYVELTRGLANHQAGTVINLAIRRVNISTEFSNQENNKTKLFKYDVFPLYPVIKLKDYGELNNISIKEKIGETQVTVAPKFLVNNCEVNRYGGLANNDSTPPTNFKSVGNLSGAEFDNQNKSKIRDFVQKDVFFVGRDQTTSFDMSKVFSQDKEVITPDLNNAESTFIIASKIDVPSQEGIIQASINFKEQ